MMETRVIRGHRPKTAAAMLGVFGLVMVSALRFDSVPQPFVWLVWLGVAVALGTAVSMVARPPLLTLSADCITMRPTLGMAKVTRWADMEALSLSETPFGGMVVWRLRPGVRRSGNSSGRANGFDGGVIGSWPISTEDLHELMESYRRNAT